MGGTNGNDMGKTTQHKNQWKGLTAMTQGYNTTQKALEGLMAMKQHNTKTNRQD